MRWKKKVSYGWTKRVRTVGLTSAAVTVASVGMGCQPCEEEFCKGLKVYGGAVVHKLNNCCWADESDSDRQECIDGVYVWNDLANEKILAIFGACHDGNQDMLKQLFDDLVNIIPRPVLKTICADERIYDLERWEKECKNLFANSMSPFAPSDSVDFDVSLFRTSLSGGAMESASGYTGTNLGGGHPPADSSHGGGAVYVVAPGSVLGVDTWLGSAEFMSTGVIAISTPLENQHGYLQASVTQFSIDLLDPEKGLSGSVTLAGDSVPSVVLVDDRGRGRIGLPVTIDMRLIDDPDSPNLGALFSETWIEIPVDGFLNRRASLGGSRVVAGLDLMPVEPNHRAILAGLFGGGGEGQLTGGTDDGGELNPCAAVDYGGGEWSQVAVNLWEQLKKAHPQCFEDDDSR